MAKVLVTGGSGYFGSVLVDDLLAAGYEVKILDLTRDTSRDTSRVAQYVGDIRDNFLVEEAMKGIDKVFHNVAQVPLAKNKELFNSVNIGGTKKRA